MGLRSLAFESVYNPGMSETDVVGEFLIPALKEAVLYRRVAGYFSSTAFAIAAQGVASLVERRGKMLLVTSHSFTASDLEKLSQAGKEKALEDALVDAFEKTWSNSGNLAEALKRRHAEAMCWMLKHGLLEVKVVIPDQLHGDGSGGPGLETFHPKFGLISDSAGDVVTFSGSANESMNAWARNLENLMVHNSWTPGQQDYVDGLEKTWAAYWDEMRIPGWKCIDLPEAVASRIVTNHAPDEFPYDLELQKDPPEDKLWPFQRAAVNSWIGSGRRGILEMATGTGKTKTAIECVNLTKSEGTLLTLVIVPYQHIGDQWAAELSSYSAVLQADGSTNWRRTLSQLRTDNALGRVSDATIVAVQDTAANEEFIGLVSELRSGFRNFLIVGDEVHWLGGRTFRKALLESANFRLGLSATPQRYFDDEGTQVLFRYFGPTVFLFELKQALATYRPGTEETILCPYEYFPVLVDLSPEEEEKVKALSQRIAIASLEDPGEEKEKKLFELRLSRSKVFKKAEGKIAALRKLLTSGLQNRLSHCIIYCEDMNQMLDVREILGSLRISFQMITGNEGAAKSRKWGDLSERQHYIKHFASGHLQVLLAIDCLDEGVDIPSARIGILIASSGNSKEFIQRRGRLMRRSAGKDSASIYDFVVAAESTDEETRQDLIRQRETYRVVEFAEDATNSEDIFKTFFKTEIV